MICRCRLPNAVRVFGRFHIAKMFNEGIDNVKRYHCAKIKNYRRKTRTQSNEIDSYEKLLEIKREIEDRFGKLDEKVIRKI